ncbi:MAG TPA: TIGR04283 family arsenosugar biosynthesis glycosyltransferase [Candidatus Saccharimonadales bacterium]|jgi:rSAM/selenodomain-associated transferase 2|nr:TIGR04283 family arsenosugar biosynthesis glycosyltransferase [Candidatus Saccharimonadales bacterium]
MKISVVIPVLNEMVNLKDAIDSVRIAVADPEIIVADGGSTDGSLAWLQAQNGVQFVQATRGKGPQQNAGAKLASGDIILFLHADCRLPADAGAQLQQVMQDQQIAGGCFLARWSRNTWALRVIAFGMNLRTRVRKTSYGDQALFLRRLVFNQVNGFPDWPLFEDTELVRRMKTAGRFVVVHSPVTMSARRFEERGIFHGIFLVYFLQIAFLLGVSPARLKRWFADIRPQVDPKDARR